MKTKLHAYSYYLDNPGDREAYEALCARMKAAGVECFETWGGRSHYHAFAAVKGGRAVELETAHLFSNQWNTAPIDGVSDKGLRVFDWAQDYPVGDMSQKCKRGHFLEITEEMRAARRNTVACGYCGHQQPIGDSEPFHLGCLGSEYLEAKDLLLLRLLPVEQHFPKRAPLSELERARLLPLYKDAQLHGRTEKDKARVVKKRADLAREYDKRLRTATAERDGFLWWMDRGIRTDNLIYYSHTERFCFGWRKPVDADFCAALLEVISEFPYPYDIKTADGRELSGG